LDYQRAGISQQQMSLLGTTGTVATGNDGWSQRSSWRNYMNVNHDLDLCQCIGRYDSVFDIFICTTLSLNISILISAFAHGFGSDRQHMIKACVHNWELLKYSGILDHCIQIPYEKHCLEFKLALRKAL
jgi:hypothetical protein